MASECPIILQQPKPGASFDSFGPNGFEFSLSANVADFGKRGAAMSDLRHRIVKAFRENGIEMPYAQHDVHLRDLDFVKTLVQRVQEVRAAEAASSAGPPKPAPPEPAPRASRDERCRARATAWVPDEEALLADPVSAARPTRHNPDRRTEPDRTG